MKTSLDEPISLTKVNRIFNLLKITKHLFIVVHPFHLLISKLSFFSYSGVRRTKGRIDIKMGSVIPVIKNTKKKIYIKKIRSEIRKKKKVKNLPV